MQHAHFTPIIIPSTSYHGGLHNNDCTSNIGLVSGFARLQDKYLLGSGSLLYTVFLELYVLPRTYNYAVQYSYVLPGIGARED